MIPSDVSRSTFSPACRVLARRSDREESRRCRRRTSSQSKNPGPGGTSVTNTPPWLQKPRDLGERESVILDMLEDVQGHDRVELATGQGTRLKVHEKEGHARKLFTETIEGPSNRVGTDDLGLRESATDVSRGGPRGAPVLQNR